MSHRLPEPDRPWMMRTYAGHSTARKSNELYRGNLAKGQTGLSIAFDLPTQTGYDADHELARGEVGKVGVPVAHKGDMHALLDGIPLDRMNTSMTINATAAWLLALYIVAAEENGIEAGVLQGTTQNDIIKEYLSRGTYAFPPAPSMRLIADMVAYTVEHVPRWNPINICSYHLQEAGATPVQEIAYAMSTAIAVLDEVRDRVPEAGMSAVFGRISFFVNAGVRFIEEHAKLRAMSELWDALGRERYGVGDPKHRRFRYGVQVNSLGLTESQPENNVQRIVLEALAVTLGRNARARAIQLPAWNEALGLPRPWDQQWSLRIQQVLAYETDVLEYPDIFEGSVVMEGLVGELVEGARAEMARVAEHGGAVEAVGYMKSALVDSHRERLGRIESGEQALVGVNRYVETESSPLTGRRRGRDPRRGPGGRAGGHDGAGGVARAARRGGRRDGARGARPRGGRRRERDGGDDRRRPRRRHHRRVGPGAARRVRLLPGADRRRRGRRARADRRGRRAARRGRPRIGEALGRTPKILVGKPGLDGHSNGAEQIAVRARDIGMDVVYEGIRLTPAQIARSAVDEGVHVIGLSILSGSHRSLIPDVIEALREAGGEEIPVVVGGIIPEADVEPLKAAGVAAVYTPKDFEITRIMRDVVGLVAERNGVEPRPREARRRHAARHRPARPAGRRGHREPRHPRRRARAAPATGVVWAQPTGEVVEAVAGPASARARPPPARHRARDTPAPFVRVPWALAASNTQLRRARADDDPHRRPRTHPGRPRRASPSSAPRGPDRRASCPPRAKRPRLRGDAPRARVGGGRRRADRVRRDDRQVWTARAQVAADHRARRRASGR